MNIEVTENSCYEAIAETIKARAEISEEEVKEYAHELSVYIQECLNDEVEPSEECLK